jgi:hypothetical protein
MGASNSANSHTASASGPSCGEGASMIETLPAAIFIGTRRQQFFYNLVALEPVVYRATRSSDDGFPPAADGEVLWLFKRDGLWVAGHAPQDCDSLDEILTTSKLVYATEENALEEGDHEWDRVDCTLEQDRGTLIGIGRFSTVHVQAPAGATSHLG